MFHDWDSYYLLIGSASAGLIGLLFVVATLTDNLDATSNNVGVTVYMSPVVFHFGVVFVLSGLAFIPRVVPAAAAGVTAVAALAGLFYALVTSVRLRHVKLPEPPHWSDFWWYGVAPSVAYVALCAVAAAFGVNAPCAELAFGIGLMGLLLIGIRNAWDLVTFLAPRNNAA